MERRSGHRQLHCNLTAMSMLELEQTASQLAKGGLLASDESTGTIGKRLEKAGFDNTEVGTRRPPPLSHCLCRRHRRPRPAPASPSLPSLTSSCKLIFARECRPAGVWTGLGC